MTDNRGWSTERPTGAIYQQAYENVGKYTRTSGKPYIEPAIPMFVPADGENTIRIVDPLEIIQLQAYYLDVQFHRNVGYMKDYFLCTKEMARIAILIGQPEVVGPCYRCDCMTGDLWDTDPEAAKALFPEHRRLLWLLNVKIPQEAGQLKLWSCPRSLSDEILSQSREPESNVFKDICHPETGVPVYFTRTGKGLTTKYSGVKLGAKPYPLGMDIAEQRFYFREILIWPKPGEVESSMNYSDAAAADAAARGENPPLSAYESDSGQQTAGTVGAAAAAQNSQTSQTDGGTAGQEYDYSVMDQLPPDLKECFRKNFDQYNECDACPWREECQKPWPLKKTSKTPKPAAAGTAGKTAKVDRVRTPQNAVAGEAKKAGAVPTPAPTPNPDNAARVQSAKEKLQAEIARRRAQQ